MSPGVHLFPYRTQKLSPVVPTIVGWWRPVKIGRCQHLYSSIAQSVERMTVNHDVTGSSPVGGAIIARELIFSCCFYPGVAQFGSALEWGSRGRWFDSSHSDHIKVLKNAVFMRFSRLFVFIINVYVTKRAYKKLIEICKKVELFYICNIVYFS